MLLDAEGYTNIVGLKGGFNQWFLTFDTKNRRRGTNVKYSTVYGADGDAMGLVSRPPFPSPLLPLPPSLPLPPFPSLFSKPHGLWGQLFLEFLEWIRPPHPTVSTRSSLPLSFLPRVRGWSRTAAHAHTHAHAAWLLSYHISPSDTITHTRTHARTHARTPPLPSLLSFPFHDSTLLALASNPWIRWTPTWPCSTTPSGSNGRMKSKRRPREKRQGEKERDEKRERERGREREERERERERKERRREREGKELAD